VFENEAAADRWFKENDAEGVAFQTGQCPDALCGELCLCELDQDVGAGTKSVTCRAILENMLRALVIQTWLNSPEYKELTKMGEKYDKFRNYALPSVP
jgi:hypothetical protein